MDISCPVKRVLIFCSSVVATLRDLHCHLPRTRCSELLPQHHPAELHRSCPIVFLQDGGVWDRRSYFRGFHHQLLQSWHRRARETLHSSLETRLEPSSRVSTPTPVCDPRCGARLCCLSPARSLDACCLGQFSLRVNVLSGQTVQRRRKLLLLSWLLPPSSSRGVGNEVPSKRFNSFSSQTESAPLP